MEPRKGAAWECQRKLLNLHKIAAETLACAAITYNGAGGRAPVQVGSLAHLRPVSD